MKFPSIIRRKPEKVAPVHKRQGPEQIGASLSQLLLATYNPTGEPSGSSLNRFATVRQQIILLRSLYESDGYAAQIVRNIISFAVGEGIHVEMGNDTIQRMWDTWRWSRLNPMSGPVELQEDILRNAVRDGAYIGEKQYPLDGDGPLKMHAVEGLSVWRTGGAGVQAGVQTDEQGITGFHYDPYLRYIGDIEARASRFIPAKDVIYGFRTEYPNQVRGLSWMRQSIAPLLELNELDKDLKYGVTRAVRDRGYWEIDEMAMTSLIAAITSAEVPEGTTEDEEMLIMEARGKAIQRLFSRVRWDDIESVPWMPVGVKWVDTPVAGVTNVSMVDARWQQVMDRIAAGVGLTRQALTDPTSRNLPIARIDYAKDLRFYQGAQRFLMSVMAFIVDAWAEQWGEVLPQFNRLYEGYEFRPAPFPYLDALRDAQALGRLVQMGVLSPQRIIRDRGMSVEAVQGEIAEWMGWLAKMLEEHGMTLGEYQATAEADEDARQSEDARMRD